MSETAEPEPPRVRRPFLRALGYAAFLGVVTLMAEKRDPEVRWHAWNGLLLFTAVAAVGIAATFVGIAIPSLSCLYVVSMLIASVFYVLIAVLAAVLAVEGRRLLIPGISRYASRLAGGS